MSSVLSPKQLAEAIGVSESSVKRWIDAGRIPVSRTEGGHRRISVPDAVKFIRESDSQVVRPDLLGLPTLDATVDDVRLTEKADALFYDGLYNGTSSYAQALLMSIYLSGRPLAEVFDGPVRSAMMKLGELWLNDENGIFLEHRATDMCLQSITRIRTNIPPADNDAPAAVGGAPSGDPYILPSTMVATILADMGFLDHNLGPDTPIATLSRAAKMCDAKLVWLSVSSPDVPDSVVKEIATLANSLAERNVPLVVGGRESHRVTRMKHPNIHGLHSMAELVAFVRGLITPRQNQASVSEPQQA